MRRAIQLFMLVEAASFSAASLVHSGYLIRGYEHAYARIAEGIIAVVLLAGLVLALIRPDWTRGIGLFGQGFALLGTLVGLYTIATGIGPRSLLDLVFHITILVVLGCGLVFTAYRRSFATE